MQYLRQTIALLCFSILPVCATSVGTAIMDCPACGHGYEITVVHSWNYGMSGGKGPPPPSATCPHCLFAWQGEVPKLTDDALKRQHAGLHYLRDSLSAMQKNSLFIRPEIHLGDGLERLVKHSQWILTGKRPLGRMKWPVGDDKLDDYEKNERAEAAALLKRIQSGKEDATMLRKEITKVSIGCIEDYLRRNDQLMRVFTLTWLLWTTDEDLADSQYVLTDIAFLLKDIPDEQWPEIPMSKGTDPAIMTSLKYLRGERNWPAAFDKALRSPKNFGVKSWIVACAAARNDRKVVPWLAKHIHIESNWQIVEMVPDYFFCVGQVSDLAILEKAHDRWVRKERKRKSFWEVSTSINGDLEEAMASLRLKLIFQTPENQTPDPRLLRKRKGK